MAERYVVCRAAALITMLLVALTACKPAEESRVKAIIGAVLIDGTGEAPRSHSVIMAAGSRISLVSVMASTPVPANADKVDGRGKFVVPAYIHQPGGLKLSEATTLEAVNREVDNGSKVIFGAIEDADNIDIGLLRRYRDLHVIFVPRLARLRESPERLARAGRILKRMSEAGIGIAALAHAGGLDDLRREWQLLSDAGLSPMEVLRASTRHAAAAIGQLDRIGTLEPGKNASLLVLSANPLEDVRNLGSIERVIINGEWGENGNPWAN